MTGRVPDVDEPEQSEKPAQELDVYNDAIQPSMGVDEFLERNNLGLGNYEESEMWQQVERFQDGMFGRAAFSDKILRRAVSETKRALALRGETLFDEGEMDAIRIDGWHELDEDEQASLSRREYLEETGDEIWRRMNDDERMEAMEIVSGIDRSWTPPHLRILAAQHELSRSRGARLLDNLFGRKYDKTVTTDEGGSRLLGGK